MYSVQTTTTTNLICQERNVVAIDCNIIGDKVAIHLPILDVLVQCVCLMMNNKT